MAFCAVFGGLANAASLTKIEAESGALGSDFSESIQTGVTAITISPSGSGYNPGGDARVASYSITFPAADSYQLYARLYVGSGTWGDDSFFYANSLGRKSSTTDSDWYMINGLASAGFTESDDDVPAESGSAGSEVWKWVKWSTLFSVNAGDLTQTFQIGGREDGLYLDCFVFAPAGVTLTVAELDRGSYTEAGENTQSFEGADGIAIHRFDETYRNINLDGAQPVGLSVMDGTLYGTTRVGGTQGSGVLFGLDSNGSNFTAVATLSGGTGTGNPAGAPAVSDNGFYGAALSGGDHQAGGIYFGTTDGTMTLLHSFDSLSRTTAENVGGSSPCEGLVLAENTLYGAASGGGAHAQGTLFSLSTDGYHFTVLHDFGLLDSVSGTNADGAAPCGGLVRSGNTLYGVAAGGGAHGAGTLFSIGTDGSGFAALHHFAAVDPSSATNDGGAFPSSALVVTNGVLYGTTAGGGNGGEGCVYSIHTDGSGFVILHHFSDTEADGTNVGGAAPFGGLLLCGDVLFGTASAGGAGAEGSVFSVDVAEEKFRSLYEFDALTESGTNRFGAVPVSSVVLLDDALYGVAFSGGPGGAGTVFRVPFPSAVSIDGVLEDGVAIRFYGAPNASYIVQSTADLSVLPIEWQNLSTNATDRSGVGQFIDEDGLVRRFYRVNSL